MTRKRCYLKWPLSVNLHLFFQFQLYSVTNRLTVSLTAADRVSDRLSALTESDSDSVWQSLTLSDSVSVLTV